MADQDASSDLTQATYTGTPYEDQQWEIVGEFKGDETFLPSEFEVFGTNIKNVIDPMFADYGGLPPAAEKRWHVPMDPDGTHGVYIAGVTKKEEPVDTRLRISPEEMERKLSEAREEGRMQALEEAIARQQENLERLQSGINTVLADIDAQFRERVGEVEQQALELSLEISKRLIGGAVEINPEYIIPILHEAIEKVGTSSIRRVRVSPEDLEFIKIIGIQKQLKEFDGTWTFEADPTITSGCVVDTSAGEIDYQLDGAWERMRDKILTVGKGS